MDKEIWREYMLCCHFLIAIFCAHRSNKLEAALLEVELGERWVREWIDIY